MQFHFQVRTGTHVMVTDVATFASVDEARVDAARRVGVLLQEHADKLWVDVEWQMDVTDASGLILFVLYIQAVKAPATQAQPGAQ